MNQILNTHNYYKMKEENIESNEYHLCKNESGFISLTVDSWKKMREKISTEGDYALVGISNIRELESLDIEFNHISNLEPLQKLKKLKELIIRYTEISDFSPLSSLPSLEILNLEGTAIKDLRPLSRLKNLKYLDLSETKVSDLSPLSSLENLEDIILFDCWESGLDISPLKKLKKLKKLYIWPNKSREHQIEELNKRSPNLEILPPLKN